MAGTSTTPLPSPTPATPVHTPTGPWLTGEYKFQVPAPKYNLEDLRVWDELNLTLTTEQQADLAAFLDTLTTSPPPAHTEHAGWVCLPTTQNKKSAKIIHMPIKYFTLRTPVVCDRLERYEPATLKSYENIAREEMIRTFLDEAICKQRFAVICLQRRYREYGYRTLGKIRFLRDLKKKLAEEAERERVRVEEERKREEARVADELARQEEERQREAKLAEAEALAADTAEKVRRKECEERARRIMEAAMARLTVPEPTAEEKAAREAERLRKGKALAIDVDTGTNVSMTPKRITFLAEETGGADLKNEVKRLVGIIRKGIHEGVIARDVGEAAIFQVRDTGRWPSEDWEKACDFENWQAKNQALQEAARDAEISDSVDAAFKDAGETEVASKPKAKKKKLQAQDKTSPKVPPLVLHSSNEVKRFVDKSAMAFYKTMAGRNAHPERPFNANIQESKDFKAFIAARGLEKLVGVGGNASWELAREFYSNLAANVHIAQLEGDDVDLQIYVRGVYVDFSTEAINKFLERPESTFEGAKKQIDAITELDAGRSSGSWGCVTSICGTDGDEVYHNNKRTLVKWKMVPEEHKGWLEWVGAHMTIMGRVTEIPVRTIFVWDQLLRGEQVDLGSLILTSMFRAVENPKSNFGHTHLIRDICVRAGVPISEDELVLPPGRTINLRDEWINKQGWTLAQIPHRRAAPDAPKRKRPITSAELSPSPTPRKRTRMTAAPGPSTSAPASVPATAAPETTPSTSRRRPPRVKHVLLKMPPPLPERPVRPTALTQETALGFMADSMNWLMDAVAQLDHYQRKQIRVSNNHSKALIRLDDSTARIFDRQSLQLEAMKADAVGNIKKSNKVLQELVSESETDEDDDDDDAPTG